MKTISALPRRAVGEIARHGGKGGVMKLKIWEIIHRNRIQKIQDMKDSWETQPPRTIEEVYTAIAKARTKAQLNVLRCSMLRPTRRCWRHGRLNTESRRTHEMPDLREALWKLKEWGNYTMEISRAHYDKDMLAEAWDEGYEEGLSRGRSEGHAVGYSKGWVDRDGGV